MNKDSLQAVSDICPNAWHEFRAYLNQLLLKNQYDFYAYDFTLQVGVYIQFFKNHHEALKKRTDVNRLNHLNLRQSLLHFDILLDANNQIDSIYQMFIQLEVIIRQRSADRKRKIQK